MQKFYLCLISTLFTILSFSQGTETFTNMPASSSSYATRTWTGDGGISWTATNARTDQSINGRAIGLNNGTLTSGNISNGIGNVSFQAKYLFTTGSNGLITVRVNGTAVGTVTVPTTQATATTYSITNINVTGNFILELQQSGSGARVAIDDLTWTSYNVAPCTPPATQATSGSISNITGNGFDLSWIAGTGTNSLVVIKAGSAVSVSPTNGTSYTANTTFGSGGTITTGEYVVYNGAGTSVSVTGLSGGTTYHVAVFTFDATGNCYQPANPATANASTPCTEPTVQVSTIPVTPSTNTATINWSGGNGSSSLVILSTANSFTPPTDGTTYTASTAYTSGQQVVYSGTGSSVNVTGLSASTTYYVTAYTFNNCNGAPDYLTTGNTVQSFTTTAVCGAGIPSGYYSTVTSQTCATLKTALNGIITSGHVQLSYGTLDDQYFPTTDDRLNDAGTATIVWDMYSDNPNGADPYTYTFGQFNVGSGSDGEGNGWNKEHSFPNSWFSSSSSTNNFPGADLHHIYPTDMDVNSLRGNYPFGKVAAATTTTANGSKLGSSAIAFSGYSGPVFEPIDAYKGDFARATLYMVTRYQAEQPSWESLQSTGDVVMDGTTWPSIEIDYLRMLLEWHNADPVSQKEIDRNNTVYCFQGNRNPFVDHPEYVGQIWSSGCGLLLPVDLTKFTAVLRRNEVVLNWTVENAQGFSHFVIERSVNGNAYQAVGKVQWTANENQYQFKDHVTGIAGKILYRLKMVDLNNTFKYSRVNSVEVMHNGVKIYPNPVTDKISFSIDKPFIGYSTATIYNGFGQVVQTKTLAPAQMNFDIPIQHLPQGKYILKLTSVKTEALESFIIIR